MLNLLVFVQEKDRSEQWK